jgi:prepilin-type N-terminal cleavage/methylation domain-containing protein/prepilin-type processing-associated H-X9-DG protein
VVAVRKGFTLIELLVVIAIIAILAAILFPVFAKAREKARQTSCASNEKQLVLASLMYAQDYDEIMPGYTMGGASCSPVQGWSWVHMIYPYIKNAQIFLCPSQDPRMGGTCPVGGWTAWANNMGLANNYGLNNCAFGGGTALADLKRPSEIYYLADDATVPMWRPSLLGSGGTVQCNAGVPWYPHNEGVNVGFADGHVKWQKTAKAWAPNYAAVHAYLPWSNVEDHMPGW